MQAMELSLKTLMKGRLKAIELISKSEWVKQKIPPNSIPNNYWIRLIKVSIR